MRAVEINHTKLLLLQTSPAQVLSYNKSTLTLPRQSLSFHLGVFGLSLVLQLRLRNIVVRFLKDKIFFKRLPNFHQDSLHVKDFREVLKLPCSAVRKVKAGASVLQLDRKFLNPAIKTTRR